MASVDVLTAARIQELINGTVASVDIDGSGFLTATLGDGSTIDIGTVITTAVTDQLVKTASINGSKHLILTLGDGSTQIDVGGLYVTGNDSDRRSASHTYRA